MKALSIRLDDRLGESFDQVCRRTGYKKNALVARLIEAFVQTQQGRSRQSKVRARSSAQDPFSKVIGIVDQRILISPNEIDDVVYGL